MAADKVKFKVGDRVRCLVETLLLSAGDEYAVRKVDGNVVWVWDDEEGLCDYPASYFEPAPHLTIRAGRYYKTRDGRKVGPMRRSSHDDEYWWTHDDANFWHPEGRVFLTQDHPDDFIAEWPDDPATDDWYFGETKPTPTTGFTVPLDAPEFGGGARFKVGDRVHYKDAYCEGVGVIHSDNDAANGYGWLVTVEEKDCDHASFNDNTTRIFTEDKLRLVAEATSGKDEEPDAKLLVTISADTSALDAEIDRVLKRLRKLKRKARKLGISLEYSELRDAA